MDNWDEVRTAYQVARMGTVSGAAEVLGVHHATVIRHIDAIEGRLGVKLFQRHARGYTATEAGQDLLRVAQATDDQLSQLAGRLKGQGDDVTGELVVTSLTTIAPLVAPALAKFQAAHPGLIVRYLTGDRLFRLEYGEAHVAIRAGAAPEQPDNVVQPFISLETGLYASRAYVAEHGKPDSVAGFDGHSFVGSDDASSRAPFSVWLRANVPAEAIRFRGTNGQTLQEAILAGAGIGFMAHWQAARHPDLVEIMGPQEDWTSKLWLVTHVDLHRSTKVQSFLSFIKQEARAWCP
ncbi:transcriptional regulator, LysR family [Cribrihabitans marinus]|uniref:Transcriptional regulator, LysR family n=1 Tax=Cribrihabitans marinus TaxID=1227549 RepID=A0A1H7D1U4_9RHOB|nr:LysR family transcriptional regulator [Cribrihabitans marinus]SEJ94807.1 transcriptional regulator, LysR family [Cribrihabitans marinus]